MNIQYRIFEGSQWQKIKTILSLLRENLVDPLQRQSNTWGAAGLRAGHLGRLGVQGGIAVGLTLASGEPRNVVLFLSLILSI